MEIFTKDNGKMGKWMGMENFFQLIISLIKAILGKIKSMDMVKKVFKFIVFFLGEFKWENGKIFKGYFQNDKMHGKGSFIINGVEEDCEFNNNKLIQK